MEKIKKNLPVILMSVICTLLLVIVILLINGNRFSFNNKTTKEETNKNNTTTIEKKENTNVNNNEANETSSNNTTVSTETQNTTPSSNPVSTPVPNVSTEAPTPNVVTQPVQVQEENIPSDENGVISYFENISNIDNNDATLSEKIKTGFVSVIDFIFYDKEIKGHTFKGLTNSAKLKVISIALKIDNKIDSYFPGYKERLSEKYKYVKEKLAALYATYTVKLCDAVGEDACNQFKQDFETMKNSFGITGDYLKDALGNAKDKLKNWYEEWRDK